VADERELLPDVELRLGPDSRNDTVVPKGSFEIND
jgi:hypothetical protein